MEELGKVMAMLWQSVHVHEIAVPISWSPQQLMWSGIDQNMSCAVDDFAQHSVFFFLREMWSIDCSCLFTVRTLLERLLLIVHGPDHLHRERERFGVGS